MSPFDFTDYPLSHSLVMALAWGAGWGLLFLLWGKDSKTAWILGGVVVSHWFLDLLVHRPDLPVLPAEISNSGMIHKYGLGLWNYPTWELILEGGLFAAGVWIYSKVTKAKDRVGVLGYWSFLVFLIAFFIISLLGTVPNNPNVVAFGGQLQLLFVVWGWWFDGHRKLS
jgi:membrane-bound metal-dependent hydrolase YbcI (DUF457 family)